MLIEQQRHYKVIQSFIATAECNENEFEVYDYNGDRVGYFVERDNEYEVYHSYECTQYGDISHEDYTSIDYTDNYNDALNMIIEEIEYDMN